MGASFNQGSPISTQLGYCTKPQPLNQSFTMLQAPSEQTRISNPIAKHSTTNAKRSLRTLNRQQLRNQTTDVLITYNSLTTSKYLATPHRSHSHLAKETQQVPNKTQIGKRNHSQQAQSRSLGYPITTTKPATRNHIRYTKPQILTKTISTTRRKAP